MSRTVLQARGLRIGYRSCAVLEDLDLDLRAGELVALLGANGAGKSTLLRTLAGLQPPLAGEIDLLGMDLPSLTPLERARRLGMVLPDRSHVGLLSVFELVSLGRHPFTDWTGRLREVDIERVEWALDRAGIGGFAMRQVGQLSDGERQKVMIARALAQEPKVLILDEPTAFLDLPGRVDILALLRQLAQEEEQKERAVLLSTHDLDLALRTADRLWLVSEGKILVGAPEDLALSGALSRAFTNRNVIFDEEQGSFRLHVEGAVGVGLEGEGRSFSWTRRALRRAGFLVLDPGNTEAALHVAVRDGEEGERWRVSEGGASKALEVESIEALLQLLRGRQLN